MEKRGGEMIIKEYMDEHINVGSLWTTIEVLRGDNTVDILHIVLKDKNELNPFTTEMEKVEKKSEWKFESTPSTPLVYMARYVQYYE